MEVIWPSGTVDRISNVSSNQFLTIQEGSNRAQALGTTKAK